MIALVLIKISLHFWRLIKRVTTISAERKPSRQAWSVAGAPRPALSKTVWIVDS
jgi:hypothetical protein